MIAVGWWLRDWEWRRKYGPKARGKLRQEGKLPKARMALENNRAFDVDWHEEARQDARELKRRNPKRSRTNIAEELAQKFQRSPRQVRDIIKPVIP